MILNGLFNFKQNKNRGINFLKYQFLCVIIFSLLYFTTDYILAYFPNISDDLLLGHYTNKESVNPYYYWLWHSLVTQTTVGYSGVITKAGKATNILNMHSNIYTLINSIQLCSTFYVSSLFM